MIHVLGIDAGGTKTVCQLADERGTLLAEARGAGANLQASGELHVEKVLHDVMEEAIGSSGARAGGHLPGDCRRRSARGLVDRCRHHASHRRARAHARRQRRARRARGRCARCARCGDHLGDRLYLLRPQRAERGRTRRRLGTCPGRRGQRILDRPGGAASGAARGGSPRPADRAHAAPAATLRRVRGAKLDSRGLSEQPARGRDRLARALCAGGVHRWRSTPPQGILRAAADELESSGVSVARRLDLGEAPFPFILAGGIFRAVPWLRDEMLRRLPLAVPTSTARVLDREPAAGAVSFAIQEATGGARIPRYRSE